MSGFALGMNFINKGIDQFSYGVGQEYNRYAREKSRKWQVQDIKNQLSYRINDGNKHGIHPLASIGASSSNGTIASAPIQPPSGGGNPIRSKPTHAEMRILNANADKAETEAKILNKELQNMGQGNTEAGIVDNGLGPNGQPDGNIYTPDQQMQKNVSFAEEYTVDSEGHAYIKPTQSNEQAFGEEGTLLNRALYNARKVNYPRKIQKLKKNWANPEYQELKRQFLITRPRDPHGRYTFLWDTYGWQRVPKTAKNSGRIFKTGYILQRRNPKTKRRPKHYGETLNQPIGS